MKVRGTRPGDIDELVDMQDKAATVALAHIFPQDEYPFPRADVRERWLQEIDDPNIGTYVATDHTDAIVGFIAVRSDELLHFGTALEYWGSGLAGELHAWAVDELAHRATQEISHARLRVFEENRRARRFYEKHGWQSVGLRSRTRFPPYPTLIEYTRPFRRGDGGSRLTVPMITEGPRR